MKSLMHYLNEKWVGLAITLSSILLISILQLFGIFDVLELKTYLGMLSGTFYAKTQHKILQDWEGLICQVK